MEIGSEYWLENTTTITNNSCEYFKFGLDNRFLLSGRTAINYVLDNILNTRKIFNVYFPSYCCESMVEPFIKRGINVEYYTVDYKNKLEYNIDLDYKCDIFFAMSYFGFSETNMDEYISNFKSKDIIVIEDITHRLLNNSPFCAKSDYLVASLRKWFPVISGGLAVNLNGKFIIDEENETSDKLVEIKKEAMLRKKDFISQNKGDKNIFLGLFKSANDMLKVVDKNLKMDNESYQILNSIDLLETKRKRVENAKLIYDNMKNKYKELLPFKLTENDCPLFVPILYKHRDNLRKELINNRIYCPIHWPCVNEMNNSIIYANELSLICDQRYTSEDIQTYIGKLIKMLEEA